MPIRAGIIGYLNTLPIHHGLALPPGLAVDWTQAPPSALNRAVAEGRLDWSPVSSAFYLRHALVIGDEALLLAERGVPEGVHVVDFDEGVHVVDLATLWAQATGGMPFVFAVWVARKAWFETHRDEAEALMAACRANRDANLGDPARFAALLAHAHAVAPSLGPSTLERYFARCLSYRLDAPHREALARFAGVLEPTTIP